MPTTTKTKKAPAATAGAKTKKSTAPTFVLRRDATDELPASYLGPDAIATEVATEAKRFHDTEDALAWLDTAVHFSEHARWAPVDLREYRVRGYTVRLLSVDSDQGPPGRYLHANEEDCAELLFDAHRFDTIAAARAWIDEETDHGIHEQWAVVDGATDEVVFVPAFDEPANAGLEAEVAQDDAPAPATMVQGELLPPDAGAAPTEPVETTGLELDAPGQARLVALGLSRFAADLAALAKKERELGRMAEAAASERDAKLIREELLAQLEPQAQLPFGYADLRGALAARVAGKFRARLTNEIRRSTPVLADEQTQDREARITERIADFEALIGSAAEITVSLVEPIVREAAERGMVAGRLARETTAATLGCEAVAAVEREE